MVEVRVPWRPAGPDRGRAWGFVNRFYAENHPTWPVHTALAPAGDWSKGRALSPAVERSIADIIVVADGDVVTDRLTEAVKAVQDGANWACPHELVHRLDAEGTDRLIAGDNSRPTYQQKPYRGVLGGGIVVARREVIISTPLDRRFIGWGLSGQEDMAWAVALQCLHGAPWRGTADLWHLWHPLPERLTRKYGNDGGRRLYRRYLKCRNDPAAMRALIEEGRHEPRDADVPPVRDRAA